MLLPLLSAIFRTSEYLEAAALQCRCYEMLSMRVSVWLLRTLQGRTDTLSYMMVAYTSTRTNERKPPRKPVHCTAIYSKDICTLLYIHASDSVPQRPKHRLSMSGSLIGPTHLVQF